MSYPLLQFVASPDTGAAVRFDFNQGTTGVDGSTEVLQDGFSLGSPTLAGDPDGIGSEYGFRELSIPLRINGTTTSAPVKFAALAQELNRQTNWLRFQATATATPYWFKTYRSAPEPLDWEQFRNLPAATVAKWYVDLKLDADSFAYGALVTLPMMPINNDPAASSNACFGKLPTILGDAPAPANVRIRYTNAQSGYRHMVSMSPVGSGVTAPIAWPVGTGDAWTAGTDTGAGVADATFSGGSYRPVTFATNAALANRLSGNAPSTVPPGRYKVLVRMGRSDTTSQFSARFGFTIGFTFIYGDTTQVAWEPSAAAKFAGWVDLGDFNVPNGVALDDMSNEPAAAPAVALQMARTTGSGEAWLDAIMLVPVGDENARTLFVDYPNLGPSAVLTDEYHDADQELVYCRNPSTGALQSVYPPRISGGYLRVIPGANNVLHFVEQASLSRTQYNGADVTDRIGTDAQVVVSYYPRWLYLAAS